MARIPHPIIKLISVFKGVTYIGYFLLSSTNKASFKTILLSYSTFVAHMVYKVFRLRDINPRLDL